MREKVIVDICGLKNKISCYKMACSYGQYQTVVLLAFKCILSKKPWRVDNSYPATWFEDRKSLMFAFCCLKYPESFSFLRS